MQSDFFLKGEIYGILEEKSMILRKVRSEFGRMIAKLKLNPVSPALFDLSQDIITEIPFEIIREWNESDQTQETAQMILEKTKVKGTIVSSDSAGLSKLSREKQLIEVLALLNSPKEIVFGTGVNIGGRGVGIWAADNTQMFYPDEVPAQKVVEAMLFAQSRIKEGTVQIGIGAHYGEFYELGGGMYGVEADFVEEFAENDTEGGEIAITESIVELLEDKDAFELTHREDLDGRLQKVFSVANGPVKDHLIETNETYPIPYSKEFYDDLIVLQKSWDNEHLTKMNDKYLEEKVVVLLERERTEYPSAEVAILNELSLMALSKKFAVELLVKYDGKEVKTAGNLGIYTFNDHAKAIEFACEIRAELEGEKISCRIGIDAGPIAVFDLPKGGRDIAGSPVNIASKMSQDFGKMGKIYLTREVFEKAKPEGFSPIEIEVSHIKIESYEG